MPSATPTMHASLAHDEPIESDAVEGANRSFDPIPSHPLAIKPLGNSFLMSHGQTARACTGAWSTLPDEVLTTVLEYLDKRQLLSLGSTCSFMYAFCHADELWKSCFLRLGDDDCRNLTWRGSWRRTTLGLPREMEAAVHCGNVFSDVLHRPFSLANLRVAQLVSGIPKSNQIPRFGNLSYKEYATSWSEQPFILTQCIQKWPIYSQWTLERLVEQYGHVEFRAEAVDWTLARYWSYMRQNMDESPLYLFDRKFAEKMGLELGKEATAAAYWAPECFGPDLLEVLGPERPAHRWLILGPERSGSSFHKDPNGTSAWNAVIEGAKYWIMFPPKAQVPGVYVSRDGGEVTSPLSIAEWLMTFHQEARRLPGCVEGICRAGEVLHVPSGWWHLVVNLESGIALTQNFVPLSPSLGLLCEVLSFLRDKPDQVSGFAPAVGDAYALFTERLGQARPEVLRKALDLLAARDNRKRKWDAVVGGDEGERGGGFSFGFGGEGDEEELE